MSLFKNLREVIEELKVMEETYGGDVAVYGYKEFLPVTLIKFERKEEVEVPSEFEDEDYEIVTLPDRVRIL